MLKGDGKHWAKADDDVQCLACAGQWRHRVQPQHQSRDIPIDAVGIEHELDILEWVDDLRVAQVDEDVSGLRVRPASLLFEEVGCFHAPTNWIAAPKDLVYIPSTCRDAGCVEGGAFVYGLGWRQAIRGMCVRGQEAQTCSTAERVYSRAALWPYRFKFLSSKFWLEKSPTVATPPPACLADKQICLST